MSSIYPRIGLWIAAAFLAQSLPGQSWTQLSPTGTPPVARGFHGTTGVYDSASNRMIVFGGRDGSGNNLNDVWVLTNANGLGGAGQWVNLIPNGATGSPPARSGHSAVYDSVNNIMIIFGGCSGYCTPALNDVWTLSNANGLGGTPVWTQLAVDAPLPPRTNAAAAYDLTNNRLFVYSGQDGSANPCSTFADVWGLSNANGLGGYPVVWEEFRYSIDDPLTSPSPGLSAAATAFDPATGVLTIFGGTTLVNDVCRDTNGVWQLNISRYPEFSTVMPDGAAGSSPARSFASAVFDASGGRMIVFGGQENGTAVDDVWSLSNATGLGSPQWSMLSPSGTPPAARSAQAAVFDSANQRMTVFAGSNVSGVLNDAWVLTAPGVSGVSCTTNAGSPNIIHTEGIADFVGDLILICTGGAPTPQGEPIPEYKITLTLNTNVTSRLLPEGRKLSEALLMIDEPFPANPVPSDFPPFPSAPPQILCTPLGSTCAETGTGGSPSPYQTQPNVFVGKQISPESLAWQIPIDPPGVGLTRVIRLTNVRANASKLGLPIGFIPVELQATVVLTGAEPVPVASPQQIVALSEPGVGVSVAGSNPIQQCVPHNASLVGGSGVAAFDWSAQIVETFGYTLKFRNYGTWISGLEFPPPLSEQNAPGFVYRTETGFYSPSLFATAPTLGLADFGTRIRAKFESLPGGARLFVPTLITMTGNYGFGSPVGQVQLVNVNASGLSSPGYEPVTATAMVGTTPVAEVNYSGSTAYAIYEVLYADSSVTETITVPVAVAFNSTPGTGEAKVVMSLAPLSASESASETSPLPRFASIYAAQPAFSIDSCSAFGMSARIANKTGPQNARVWTVDVSSGVTPASATEIESFTLSHTSGPVCTPSITSPSFPYLVGDIPANFYFSNLITIDFTGCSSTSKFTVNIGLSANGGTSNATVVLKHQTL